LSGHDFFWPIVSFVHNIDRFKYSNLAIKYEFLSFVQQKVLEIIQTLKLAKKTSKDDYMTHLRLVLLGIGIVGGIAFVIKLIAEFLTFNGE
jgi:protein transport protein SEC61 subunit gamma and related proteins